MPQGRPKNAETPSRNRTGAPFGFEAQLFLAAATLRTNLEPSDDAPVAWGPICLMPLSPACGKPVRGPRAPLCQRGTPGQTA
jgi:hypothetical protein